MSVLTPQNSLRTFALVCVAVTSVFIMGVSTWLIYLLQSDWCGSAIGAVAESKGRPESAVSGCFNLLNQQVAALAWSNHIALGVLALSLFVLIVIVIAGGRASFKLSKEGAEANVSRDAGEAAQVVADAAQDKATEVQVATVAPTAPPTPDPEMPEVK